MTFQNAGAASRIFVRLRANVPDGYAYRVHLNPGDPDRAEWGTHVRDERMRVGDRLTLPGTSAEWQVVRIELVGNEGQPAAVRWLGRPNVIWDGTLVLRAVG